MKTLLVGGELELYEQPELLAELRRIETVTTPGAAAVRIRRLGHSHGDVATALALCLSKFKGSGVGMKILNPNNVRAGLIGGRSPTLETFLRGARW